MTRLRLAVCACAAVMLFAPLALAADVVASAPRALSVTIYRNPDRAHGAIRLESLGGFALITETRRVTLPKGVSRLRFEGVVDGVQPETALITGLGDGIIEKNRDAALLSPEALVKASLNADVTLIRTDRKTGKSVSEKVLIRSANSDGVVFETSAGLEAFRCSGQGETFQFDRPPKGLTPTPTLSVLLRVKTAMSAEITLSYLARNFDWAANYVATIAADDQSLDLGGWITLANGNDVGLKDVTLQVVAGRLNRNAAAALPVDNDPRLIARCWPSGTTGDPAYSNPYGEIKQAKVVVTARRMEPMAIPMPPPPPPPPEPLGDLKLYRIGFSTSIEAHQSKQVRLIANEGVPFARIYGADLFASGAAPFGPAEIALRLINGAQEHLGSPLPSGVAAVFEPAHGRELLLGEAPLSDTALNEPFELRLGHAPEVQVHQTKERFTPDAGASTVGDGGGFRRGETLEKVEITNASSEAKTFELRLRLNSSDHVRFADHLLEEKDGQPIFRLSLPPQGRVVLRYALTS